MYPNYHPEQSIAKGRQPIGEARLLMTDLEQLSQYVRMSTFPHAIADVNSLPIFIPFGFADNVLYSSDEYACAGVYTEIPQAGVMSEGVVPRLPRKQCADIGLAPLGRAT